MRFAFITSMLGSPWGGSEELWSQAAIRLVLTGHKSAALVPFRSRLSEKVSELAQQGVRVRTYPAPSFLAGSTRYFRDRLTLGWRRTYAWLKRFSPDLVIISQGEIEGGREWTKVCREAGIPYVIILQCNSESMWLGEHSLGESVASYTGARSIFCVSRGNLDLLQHQVGELLPRGEIVWNPYNVSPERIADWPSDTESVRVACVARLDPAAKGQDLLLQVMARPEWRERPIQVNFFGEGPYDLTLRRLAGLLQLRSVQFRGHVSNINAIWDDHHILALPSRFEGLPLALVESMWCGRPAVVTDVAGNAELCVDGETGFVASSPTFSSFAEAMERAWRARTQWKQMGEAARARVERLVPHDPVSVFCCKLESCVAGTSPAAPSRLTVMADREKGPRF